MPAAPRVGRGPRAQGGAEYHVQPDLRLVVPNAILLACWSGGTSGTGGSRPPGDGAPWCGSWASVGSGRACSARPSPTSTTTTASCRASGGASTTPGVPRGSSRGRSGSSSTRSIGSPNPSEFLKIAADHFPDVRVARHRLLDARRLGPVPRHPGRTEGGGVAHAHERSRTWPTSAAPDLRARLLRGGLPAVLPGGRAPRARLPGVGRRVLGAGRPRAVPAGAAPASFQRLLRAPHGRRAAASSRPPASPGPAR